MLVFVSVVYQSENIKDLEDFGALIGVFFEVHISGFGFWAHGGRGLKVC